MKSPLRLALEEKPDHSLHRRSALRPPPFLQPLQINYMTSADYDLQIQARLPVADIEVFLSFIDMNKWNRIQQYEAYNYAIIKYMQNDISFLYTGMLVLDLLQ